MDKKNFYIFSNGELKRKDNTLFFESKDGMKKNIPVEAIEIIYLFGEIDLNTKLLNFLAQKGIILFVFNYYGFYAGCFAGKKSNLSGFVTIKQAEKHINEKERLFIAKSILSAGIFHITKNLRYYKLNNFIEKIEPLIKSLEEMDSIQKIMGYEGDIRNIYYSAFNDIIGNKLEFDKRTKRPPQNCFNTLISFGNSLMYTTVLNEIFKTQLNPEISFLHAPSTKRYSLTLDIAEIFKPLIVDPVIFTLINNNMIKPEHFEQDLDYVWLNEEGRKIFLKLYEEKLLTTVKHRVLKRKVSYRHFIRLECYKLMKHFIDDEKYKPLKAWW